MRLQEILTTPVIAVQPGDAAESAWTRMREARIRHLVVTERGRVVGVVSDRDLGGNQGAAVRRGRKVAELMTRSPAVAAPTMTLRQAANLMRGRLIGSLPVVLDGRLVGIVTASDVLEELGRGSSRPAGSEIGGGCIPSTTSRRYGPSR
ncbi:MAG: CBS domain-containing protein [Gammaproteobacteria bacterium]